uniref:Uncharacterized protein n=2 Tax=Cacopsylla melanoneura TaxID=428564 RepID=A0A8D8SMU7_9HEMI
MESSKSSSNLNFNFKSNDFDLANGGGNFFKSSFARTMAFENSHQSKSLDFMYFDQTTNISEESEDESDRGGGGMGGTGRVGVKLSRCVSPSGRYPSSGGFRKLRSRSSSSDAAKFWKRKQESLKKELSCEKQDAHSHSEENLEEELLRLRKERDHLLEENRRLQGDRSESPTLLEVSAYQSQLDTLQWQLKHVESNRQMYRAVMEQILKFLERVQKCLDQIQTNRPAGQPVHQSPSKNRARVPRSRSVHTVAHTSSPNSRASSPSSHNQSHYANPVQRANSVHHMQDSYSTHSLRDFSWRSSRPLQEDIVTPEKLSQDTFRLLRTIQSLVNTREPDLAQLTHPRDDRNPLHLHREEDLSQFNLNRDDFTPINHHQRDNLSELHLHREDTSPQYHRNEFNHHRDHSTHHRDDLSQQYHTREELSHHREELTHHRLTPSSSDLTLSEQRQAIDTNSVGSCSSLLHSSSCAGGSGSGSGTRKSLGSSCSTSSTHCEELEVLARSSPRPTSIHPSKLSPNGGAPSVEDESGFSSLSSFHESGLPEFKAGYPELGLPLVESLDQRWNASPALSEQIRVLWV